MIKKLFILVFLLVLITVSAQDTKEVLSKGFGTTVDLATQNALSQAVREAVGALVDEETLIKNDELIEEKILTFSNGIVQDYKIVKEPRKNAQGLIEITIKATVKSNLLKKKLEEAKIVQGTVENGEEVWRNAMAQIVTEAQRKENSIEVIKKLFNSIKPEQFLNVKLVDTAGGVNENAKLDIKANTQEKTATISINAVIEIDNEKYFRELFPYVKQTLDYVCEEKYDSLAMSLGQDKLSIGKNELGCCVLWEPGYRPGEWKKRKKDGTFYVYLQTNKRPSRTQIIFTEYVLTVDRNSWKEMTDVFRSINNKLSLVLSLYDKDKETILQKEVLINSYKSGVKLNYYTSGVDILNGKNNCILVERLREIFILPMIASGGGIGEYNFTCSDCFPVSIQFNVSLDDVKDIRSFDAKISIKRD